MEGNAEQIGQQEQLDDAGQGAEVGVDLTLLSA